MCHWCVMLTLMYDADETQKKQKIAFFFIFSRFFLSFLFRSFHQRSRDVKICSVWRKQFEMRNSWFSLSASFALRLKKLVLWIRKISFISVFFARSIYASLLIAMSKWVKINSWRFHRRRKCSNRSNKE